MIGLAQPQTATAMAHKTVSQPYANYLNVTTIKTSILSESLSAFSHGMFTLNKIKQIS
jgi:hypothetical protein